MLSLFGLPDDVGNEVTKRIVVTILVAAITSTATFFAGRWWGRYKASRQWHSKEFLDRIIVSLNIFADGYLWQPISSIEKIQALVCERFSVTIDELTGDRRSQNIVYPRQVAMYLSRELTDSSLPKIGKEFGGRDHTTVIHATSKIARLIREDRSVYNLVQELTARVRQAR